MSLLLLLTGIQTEEGTTPPTPPAPTPTAPPDTGMGGGFLNRPMAKRKPFLAMSDYEQDDEEAILL